MVRGAVCNVDLALWWCQHYMLHDETFMVYEILHQVLSLITTHQSYLCEISLQFFSCETEDEIWLNRRTRIP